MAGDDDEAKARKPGAADILPVQILPAGIHSTVKPAAPASSHEPHSEWTVSDRRGPLSAAASTGDGVERVVPDSEMDAEGTADPALTGSVAHAAQESDASATGEIPGADAAETDTSALHAHVPAEDHVLAEHEAIDTGPSGEMAPPGDDEAAPPAALSPEIPPRQRRSPWPVAAALVVGALVGAGSAALVYIQSSAASPDAADSARLAQLTSRVDALDKRPDPQAAIAGLKSQIDDLGGQLAALRKSGVGPVQGASPQTAQAPGDVAAQGGKLAALQANVDALQKQVGSQDLGGKIAALQAAVGGAQAAGASAGSTIAALQTRQQALDGKVGTLQTAIAGAQKQASAAQSGIDAVQSQQKILEGKLGAPALAVVSDSLVEQIQAGKPFTTQVDALASLGADPAKVAVLRQNAAQGVPWAKALLVKFKPLEDPIIATGAKAPANAGFLARLQHGLLALVSIRRADQTTGTDVASRVALIEADLAHDDVTGAYATWTALPADAKKKSEAWGALAKTSVEAINAARDLQSGAIGALATKRS